MPSPSWTVRLALSLALGLAVFFTVPHAFAQSKVENAAKTLQKKAMEEDYLASEFGKAQDKLEKALTQCGADKCNAGLRARLKRDLGVVQIGGAIDRERAIGNFQDALKLDPSTSLDPDTKTKDLEAAFAEARKRNGGGGATAAPKKTLNADGQPEGDFSHTPIAQQQVRTPIPVYAEFSGEASLVRVTVRYKGFGMTDWKPVELKKMGDKGWGGLIPCGDVQQGTTQYYIQGFDTNNDAVASGGDRNNPYRVAISQDRPAEQPHLPNAPPPSQCADTGECPPGFPGCKKGAAAAKKTSEAGKDEGEFCEEDSECGSEKCTASKCAPEESEELDGPKIWVGISGALDYAFVPSEQDVCRLKQSTLPLNQSNYYCVDKGGADYPSRDAVQGKTQNSSIVPSANKGSDKVGGGGAFGNIRLLLTIDYAITSHVMLGARLGIVLNNYPGDAAGQDGARFSPPIHAELRGTYLFGKDPLYTTGFAPFVFGAAGLGQFETKVPGNPTGVATYESQPTGAPVKHQVEAWHIAGPAFFALGGGLRYAFATGKTKRPRLAIQLGLRGNFAFLNAFEPSVGPELGVQLGF